MYIVDTYIIQVNMNCFNTYIEAIHVYIRKTTVYNAL